MVFRATQHSESGYAGESGPPHYPRLEVHDLRLETPDGREPEVRQNEGGGGDWRA